MGFTRCPQQALRRRLHHRALWTPGRGIHAVVQLEINRGLYMNERTLVPKDGLQCVMDALNELMDARCLTSSRQLQPLDREAAE